MLKFAERRLQQAGLDEHTTEVVLKSVPSLALKVLGFGGTFVFNVLLARYMGAKGVGIVAIGIQIYTFAQIFARLGTNSIVMKRVAAGLATENPLMAEQAMSAGLRWTLLGSAITAGIVVLLATPLAHRVYAEPDLRGLLWLFALALTPFSLFVTINHGVKALRRTWQATGLNEAFRSTVRISGLLILVAIGLPITPISVGWIFVVAAVAALGVNLSYWLHQPEGFALKLSASSGDRQVLRESLPLVLVSSMFLLISSTDTIMLGWLVSAEEAGVYYISARVALLTSFVIHVVNSIVAPKFSQLYARNELAQLQRMGKSVTLLLSASAVPILLVFLAFPAQILSLFGSEFADGAATLRVLALGQFVNLSFGSVGYLLIMSGNERIMRDITIGGALVNIVANYFLIVQLGAFGAALASAGTLLTMRLAIYIAVRKRLGFWLLGSMPLRDP
ncbi:MAG: flippase [Bacteroidota bacterium]